MNEVLISTPTGSRVAPADHIQASARLESLRGLAAIQVAMFHSLLVLQSSPGKQQFVPTMIALFNGRSAVTLFFVLSGLVLGLSLRRSVAAFSYVYFAYAVRRFFRIYPAFLVSTAVTCGLIYSIHHFSSPTPSAWINLILPSSVTFHSLWRNLLFLDFDMNSVTWTLKLEMVCSLFLPICFYGGNLSPLIPWLMLLASIVVAAIFPTTPSAAVLQAFLIGYLIPSTREVWRRISTTEPAAIALTLGGLAVLLLTRSLNFSLSTTSLVEAIGAAVLIASVTYGLHIPLFTILDRHLVKMAGRISYSYYLFHPLALILVAHIFLVPLLTATGHAHPFLCALVLWTASSSLAFPIAWLSYEWVEKPMILFSKSVWPHSPRPPRPS